MKTPIEYIQELDDRFAILIKNEARNIKHLNGKVENKLPFISINKIEYTEKFKKDKYFSDAIGRIEQLGNCVGMSFY